MNKFVAIIVIKNNSFLLVKNKKRSWEFPGGKIEPNETPTETAKREFLEETGYELNSVKLIKQKNDGYYYLGSLGKSKTKKEHITKFFEELPEEISFNRKEYQEIIKLAKEIQKNKGKK